MVTIHKENKHLNKYEQNLDETNLEKLITEDRLDNKEYLEPLVRILSAIDDNETICIDGDWGSGKTILIKQLEYLINNADNNKLNIPSEEMENALKELHERNLIFYYNAWENDNHEDALESIIYNILKKYPKYKNDINKMPTKDSTLKEILEILEKLFARNLLGIDHSESITNQIQTFGDLAKNIYTVEEKRKEFQKLIDKILNGKRMILIIDELDRCNPTFACKILETIKHFYNLKNVTIIIAANNRELIEIIKKNFGENFDAQSYLSRFYDFSITIDNNRSKKYCEYFLNFSDNRFIPCDTIKALIKKYNMTLRDCNKYRILYDSTQKFIESKSKFIELDQNQDDILRCIILPIILVMKIKDITNYNKILNGEYSVLKEPLIYIQKEFDSDEKPVNLVDIIKINKKEPTFEDVAENIISMFQKTMKNVNISRIFLNEVKVGEF